MNNVIIRALVTEKSNKESEKRARYSFYVNPKANKLQIKEAISATYGVDAISVSTLISAPKVKKKSTKRGLQVGKTNKMKKAIVSLAEGQEIDIF